MSYDHEAQAEDAGLDASDLFVENTLLGRIADKGTVCLGRLSRSDDGMTVQFHMSMEGAFITVTEAAELLTVTRTTVRHLMRQGKLKKCQIGDEIRISWESFISYFESVMEVAA